MASKDSINELRNARKKKEEENNRTARQTTSSAAASRTSSIEELREKRAQQNKSTSARVVNTAKSKTNQTTQQKTTSTNKPQSAWAEKWSDILKNVGDRSGEEKATAKAQDNSAYRAWAANNPTMAKAQEARSAVENAKLDARNNAKTALQTGKGLASASYVDPLALQLLETPAERLNFQSSAEAKMAIDVLESERSKLTATEKSYGLIKDPDMGKFASSIELKGKIDEIKPIVKQLEEAEKQALIDSGEYRDGSFFGDAIGNSFNRSYYNAELGSAYTDRNESAIDTYENELASDKYKFFPSNWLEKGVSFVAEQAGLYASMLSDPMTQATALGSAGTAFVLGQAGPQAVIPEEIISVPGAYALGAKAGITAQMYKIEAGLAYKELLDAGVTPETASWIAAGAGVINAGIELAQVEELAKSAKILTSNPGTKNIGSNLAKSLYKYGVNVFIDTAEEVAQEYTTIQGVQLGSKIDTGEVKYSDREVNERIGETAKSSALGFGFMSGTGSVIGYTVNKAADMPRAKSEAKVKETADKVKGDSERLGEMVDYGKSRGEGSKAFDAADRIERKIQNGEEVSTDDVAELIVENSREYMNENIDLFANNEDNLQGLIEEGQDIGGKSSKIADRIASKVNRGEEVTRDDIRKLMEANDKADAAEQRKVAEAKATESRNAYTDAVREATGYGENGVKTFISALESKGDVADVDVKLEFDVPYNAGFVNKNRNMVKLDTPLAQAAYKAGLADRALSIKEKSVTVWGDESGLIENDISNSLPLSKQILINKASKVFGMKTDVVERLFTENGRGEANASMSSSGVMTLSKNADKPLVALLAHEPTHRMQQLAPEAYTVFRDFAVQRAMRIKDSVIADMRYDYYDKSGGDVNLMTEEAMDEIAAQFAEEIFGADEAKMSSILDEIIAEIEKEESTANTKSDKQSLRDLWNKVLEFFQTTLDKLKALRKDPDIKNNSIASAELESTISDIEAGLKLWKDAAKASAQVVQEKTAKGEVAQKNTTTESGGERYDINMSFESEINAWDEEGRPDGDKFILGSTGPVLQGLGAIESDIYMWSDKINYILAEHPEMTLREIKKIPYILEDPILILHSLNADKAKYNTRLVMFGSYKGKNGKPILTVIDMRPVEGDLIIEDMQKVDSAYTKTTNPIGFVRRSTVIHADEKRTTSLLRMIGFRMPTYLQHSGSVGSITYKGKFVNINGMKFSDVVKEGSQRKYDLQDNSSASRTVDDAINQSMTMEQAKDMVQRAFVVGGIKEWFEGEYRTGDEWLKGEGSDDVAMVVENDWRLQERFINKVQGILDEDFTVTDVLDAYLAGTLTGATKNASQPQRLNVASGSSALDTRFYAPRQIENAKSVYEVASQTVTNKNRDAVTKARADIIMFAHTLGAAEALGLTQAELNAKVRQWARYTARAKEVSQRFNAGVAEWNRWTGIENSNLLNRATVSNEDLDRLVGTITGDNDGFQRKYIMRTMLALDTHIDYTGLNFEFVGRPDSNRTSVNGLYSDSERKIRVKYNAPYTVAHEMGHYLDYQWARDIGVAGTMTDKFGRERIADAETKQWATNFDIFREKLDDVADIGSGYTMDSKEVFARFVDKFVRWVNFTANGEQAGFVLDRNDKFTAQHYIEFVRLLQEKAVLDGKRMGESVQTHNGTEKQYSLKGVRVLEDASKQAEINRLLQQELKDVQAALEKQIAKTERAKGELKLTQPTVKKEAVGKLTRSILREYSSDADATTIGEQMQELGDTLLRIKTTEEWDAAKVKADEIARSIVEDAREMYYDDLYDGIKQYFRNTPIYVSESVKNGITDYKYFRVRNMSRMRLNSKEGIPVDVAWDELNSMYGDLFDSEIINPIDQLQRMSEILDEAKPMVYNPFGDNASAHAEVVDALGYELMSKLIDIPQTPKTFADKQFEKQERLKQLLREQKQQARERFEEKVSELNARHREQMAKASDSQKAKELRAKIQRHVAKMEKRLFKPTKTQNIPVELHKAVADVLSAINMESNFEWVVGADGKRRRVQKGADPNSTPTKRTEAFNRLISEYKKVAEANSYGITIDPDLMKMGEGARDMLQEIVDMYDIPIASMNSSQLSTVWKVLRAVERTVLDAGKILTNDFIREKYEDRVALANAFLDEAKTRRKHTTADRHFTMDFMDPYTYFSQFGQPGLDFFRMLRNAQDDHAVKKAEISEMVSELVSAEKRVELEKDIHEFETQAGEKLTLSKAHIMDMYLLYNRPQGKQHLLGGGIYQPAIKGKVKKGTEPTRLNEVDLGEMFSKLTTEDRVFAQNFRKITDKLAEWADKANVRVYGYEKFGDPNYWSIFSAEENVKWTVDKSPEHTRSVGSIGAAKNTTPQASNPVNIYGMFEAFDRHAADMLNYAAWLAPMKDAEQLFNIWLPNEDGSMTSGVFKNMLNRVGGAQSDKYWRDLLEDIQNGIGSKTESETGAIVERAIGSVRKAAIAANMRVVIQQPTALARALVVIDPKYMAMGLAKGVTTGKGTDKARLYSPTAARKFEGNFDMGTSIRSMAESFYKPESVKGKAIEAAKEAPLYLAGKADELAWGKLWNACEHQIKHTRNDLVVGSDEWYAEVKALFDDTIDQTQVVDGILQRSKIMRSSNAMDKWLTAYKGEPLKTVNLVMRSWNNWRYQTDPAKRSAARKKWARSMFALSVNAVLNAVAQSIWDGIRDDDDEEKYLKRAMNALTGLHGDEKTWGDYVWGVVSGNLVSGFNPLSMLPGLSDIWSIAEGFDVNRPDAEAFSRVIQEAKSLIGSFDEDGGKTTKEYSATRLISRVAYMFGSGSFNLLRDIESVVRAIQVETDDYEALYKTEKAKYDVVNNKSKFIGILYRAYAAGDMKAYEAIYRDLIKHGVSEKSITSAMESRMKQAEGVSSVKDLNNRYLSPTNQKKYNSTMSSVKKSSLWNSATNKQKSDAENLARGIVSGSNKGAVEKIEVGAELGLTSTDYILYQLALKVYDEPNSNGTLGTTTVREKALALLEVPGLSEAEMAYLYDEKLNDGAAYDAYLDGYILDFLEGKID